MDSYEKCIRIWFEISSRFEIKINNMDHSDEISPYCLSNLNFFVAPIFMASAWVSSTIVRGQQFKQIKTGIEAKLYKCNKSN